MLLAKQIHIYILIHIILPELLSDSYINQTKAKNMSEECLLQLTKALYI